MLHWTLRAIRRILRHRLRLSERQRQCSQVGKWIAITSAHVFQSVTETDWCHADVRNAVFQEGDEPEIMVARHLRRTSWKRKEQTLFQLLSHTFTCSVDGKNSRICLKTTFHRSLENYETALFSTASLSTLGNTCIECNEYWRGRNFQSLIRTRGKNAKDSLSNLEIENFCFFVSQMSSHRYAFYLMSLT